MSKQNTMRGPVILDVEGIALTAEECELLQHPNVGGVILFSRNFSDKSQLLGLVKSIRALRNSLLIAVDQEGGRVQRFLKGFTELLPLSHFGWRYQQSPTQALSETEKAGFIMASEIKAMDIDISFAPVLDLNWGVSQIIGTRSFHKDPNIVVALAKAYIRGMKKAGMLPTGKHFPGHGAVVVDSHVALPKDDRDFDSILQFDLIPYIELAQELGGVMIAHIVYPAVDNELAGFSSFWLQKILREYIKFQGTIFSDDLTMAGAKIGGNLIERARKALAAGCDMILVCNNRKGAIQVLEAL